MSTTVLSIYAIARSLFALNTLPLVCTSTFCIAEVHKLPLNCTPVDFVRFKKCGSTEGIVLQHGRQHGRQYIYCHMSCQHFSRHPNVVCFFFFFWIDSNLCFFLIYDLVPLTLLLIAPTFFAMLSMLSNIAH